MISEYGLCTLPAVPMRAACSHRSEMVSQLLFGEGYRVLQIDGEWVEIETTADGYHGFIASNQHEGISGTAYDATEKLQIHFTQSKLHVWDESRGCSLSLAPSSTLRLTAGGNIQIGKFRFTLEEAIKTIALKDILRSYEGAPYLWGGRTPWGIDCSGFTQAIFRTQGILLPRDAAQQALLGTPVTWEECGPGDLAFFQNEKGHISHVGLLLPEKRIQHCSGCVRKDRLDAKGIFCEDKQKYSHTLHSIKHITHLTIE